MKEIDKLAKIIHKEVGFLKTPKRENDPFSGFDKIPKRYPTFRDFARHVFQLQKDGTKTYGGLSVDYIINYAMKFKPKICKTILEQLNINGKVDKIIVIDRKQPKIEFAKDVRTA